MYLIVEDKTVSVFFYCDATKYREKPEIYAVVENVHMQFNSTLSQWESYVEHTKKSTSRTQLSL